MGIVAGYLVLMLGLGIWVFLTLHEARRAHLVSPIEARAEDDRPPLSPTPLRIVLAATATLALVDAVFLGFLLPSLAVSLIGGGPGKLPHVSRLLYLLNLAFDLAVLRIAWSAWRFRRGWHVAGVIAAGTGLLVVGLVFLSPAVSLARWSVKEMVVSKRGELLVLGVLFAAWLALGVRLLVAGAATPRKPAHRDEEWANRSEPLTEAERVRVRWARGEATAAERDRLV
jgi:hypothetical protein